MKNTFIATGLAVVLASSTAFSGSLEEPIVVPEIIVEEAASSSSGALIPLVLLGLVVAAVALNGGGSDPAPASDARLKTDIIPVGTAANGLPLYQFRYVGLPTVYEGVMAQDVLTHSPGAVVHLPLGLMAVDYTKLGLEMRVID